MITFNSFTRFASHYRPSHTVFQNLICRRITAAASALSSDSKTSKPLPTATLEVRSDNASDAAEVDQTPPEVDIFDKHSPDYWRKDKSLPEYKRHKLAMKEKLNGKSWQPHKRVSREVMDHMKQLARQDPAKWTAETLGTVYQKSPEAIRRILKSKYEPKIRTKAIENDVEEWSKLKEEAAVRVRSISGSPGYKRASRHGSGQPWKRESQISGYTIQKRDDSRRRRD